MTENMLEIKVLQSFHYNSKFYFKDEKYVIDNLDISVQELDKILREWNSWEPCFEIIIDLTNVKEKEVKSEVNTEDKITKEVEI